VTIGQVLNRSEAASFTLFGLTHEERFTGRYQQHFPTGNVAASVFHDGVSGDGLVVRRGQPGPSEKMHGTKDGVGWWWPWVVRNVMRGEAHEVIPPVLVDVGARATGPRYEDHQLILEQVSAYVPSQVALVVEFALGLNIAANSGAEDRRRLQFLVRAEKAVAPFISAQSLARAGMEDAAEHLIRQGIDGLKGETHPMVVLECMQGAAGALCILNDWTQALQLLNQAIALAKKVATKDEVERLKKVVEAIQSRHQPV